jgi:hypothetical protein
MSERRHPTRSRWAPWWANVVPIVVANLVRQALAPPGEVDEGTSVGIFTLTALAIVVVVTGLHRMRR